MGGGKDMSVLDYSERKGEEIHSFVADKRRMINLARDMKRKEILDSVCLVFWLFAGAAAMYIVIMAGGMYR